MYPVRHKIEMYTMSSYYAIKNDKSVLDAGFHKTK